MLTAAAGGHKNVEPLISKMEKYVLFETATYFYLLGCDALDTSYKLLKLDRCVKQPKTLSDVLLEDPNIYTKDEMTEMLKMINEGNKTSGGLTQMATGFGIVGFVRFLDCFYFTLITQRKKVGCIANNDIYAIKAAEVFAIRPREKMEFSLKNVWNNMKGKINRTTVDTAESRYMGLFQFIDISKDFFFSYTYDLTHSFQFNYNANHCSFPPPPHQEIFEWNHHQTEEMRACLGDLSAAYWILPIIHGSFQQRRFDFFGKTLDIALIARRSRHYAGTRYLKRGISVHGKVANDCEMEQIMELIDGVKPKYASHVQMRGSIPTYWYQETSVTMPKPPILVSHIDPTYLATQHHFADLLTRYGAPIVVLDLVKQTEKRKRESIIGKEFRQAVEVVNLTIPDDKKIRYVGLDFSRMSKAAKHSANPNYKGKPSIAVAGAGAEWSSFEQSLGNQVKDSRGSSADPAPGLRHAPSNSNLATNSAAQDNTGGKIDVLKELKGIAAWTLGETSFFCSSIEFLDRVKNYVSPESFTAATSDGFMQQSGVLRTNCIDCLDRTNVGQFAAGASFLNVAISALGLLNSPADEPSSGLLLGVMDLYSEMGDKIALQYGGSNAHKKVSGNSKGLAQAGQSASKPNELLTSIKRYYSNAFTDRLKQDAMNLFLGYFIPSQSDSPLWDLENDYLMHNRLLRPEQPISISMLYNLNSFVHKYYGRGSFFNSLVSRKSLVEKGNCPDVENAAIVTDSEKAIETEVSDVMSNFDHLVGGYLIRTPSASSRGRSKSGSNAFLNADNIDEISRDERLTIYRHEKRKLNLHQKQIMLYEAYQMWWKDALHAHTANMKWMSLAPPEVTFVVPYFERTYETLTLTSFDEKLMEDYMVPFDATQNGVVEEVVEGNSYFARGKNFSTAGATSGRDSISLTISQGGDRSNLSTSLRRDVAAAEREPEEDFQFSLSKFVLDIGKQATKALVNGIMGRDDVEIVSKSKSTSDKNNSSGSGKTKNFRNKIPHWKDACNSENGQLSLRSLIDLPITDESQRIYDEYEGQYIAPELFISQKTDSCRMDYETILKNNSISADDVYGMENMARDSIVCDIVKDGIYLGLSREESALDAQEAVLNSLIFIEEEIANYMCFDSNKESTTNKRNTNLIVDILATPVKSLLRCESVARSSTFADAPHIVEGDQDALVVAADAAKALQLERDRNAARAAANYSKSIKQASAAAMAASLAALEDKSRESAPENSPEVFVHVDSSKNKTAAVEGGDEADSESDDDEVRLDELAEVNDDSNTRNSANAPQESVAETVMVIRAVENVALPTKDEAPISPPIDAVLASPSSDADEKRLVGAVSQQQVKHLMNNFLTTPLFEKSAALDDELEGVKTVMEMLDIPSTAKKVITKISTSRHLAPGLEDEIYRLSANYMFQQTMYSRSINLSRLAKRMSSCTTQQDLLLYTALFSVDELAAHLDDILFITSSDQYSRFFEVEYLKQSLKARHAEYLLSLKEFRSSMGLSDTDSVMTAIQELEEKRVRLLKISTELLEFLRQLEKKNDAKYDLNAIEEKLLYGDINWFACPDSVEEEYLKSFRYIHPDLFQKLDNEYVIANKVAMMSMYAFHNHVREHLNPNVWA